MVTHHIASPITANARGRSAARTLGSRSVVSVIAVIAHASALAPAAGSPVCSRFHAARQRAEQNRACSRRGTNEVPHCSQSRMSATGPCYAQRVRPSEYSGVEAAGNGGWRPSTARIRVRSSRQEKGLVT